MAKLVSLLQNAFDAARCRGATYNTTGVADCIATTQAYSASCPMYYSGGLGWAYELSKMACARVFDGTQQPGEPCDSNFDCAQIEGSMTTCVFHDGISECVRTLYGAQGASCDPFARPIETDCNEYEGLDCSGGQCVALGQFGDACVYDGDCVREAYCESASCQPRKALGEACDDNCEYGLKCVNGICGGELGAACSAGSECSSSKCIQGRCVPFNNLVSGLLVGMNCY